MDAYYYQIVEFNELSQREGEIVDEGIIRSSEDTIYPGQNANNSDLPYECEAHHFKAVGYRLNLYSFSISREEILDRAL